ncbi:MAG: DUF2868 domain-containing protein [Verrucomicrobiaceae bacterium]
MEELIDFEVELNGEPSDTGEIGQEIRREMRKGGAAGDGVEKRRWGLKYWLLAHRSPGEVSPGRRVTAAARIVGLAILILTFLAGVGVVKGLITTYEYEGGPYILQVESDGWMTFDLSNVDHATAEGQKVAAKGFNIWLFLGVTLGIQWLLILAGIVSYLLIRRWSHGLMGLKAMVGGLVRRFSGQIGSEEWAHLIKGKKQHKSALGWRLTRVLQLGGVGYNVGLLIGLFGVLWFSKVGFYWESTLPVGAPSLEKVTSVIAFPWGGERPTGADIGLSELRDDSDYRFESHGESMTIPVRLRANLAWAWFFFLAIMVWGLLPRLAFLIFAVWKERKVLAGLEFQDPAHRELWRELSQVERSFEMEGLRDGVVLCDVGGLEVETEVLRPFLLKTLRVNPEARYSVDVLDQEEEREAWEAMREAPCGVVILVEGWNLSPKQFTGLWKRMRHEAGNEMVIRVLVLGKVSKEGVAAPPKEEVEAWTKVVDEVGDPLMECLPYTGGNEAGE